MLYVLIPLIFVISSFFAMIGQGGGTFYVPLLLFAGITMKSAPALSLILILSTSLAALLNYWRNRQVDWRLALVIDPPTDIMAFVGAYFSAHSSPHLLRMLLAGVLILSGFMMLRRQNLNDARQIHHKGWWIWSRNFQGHSYSVNIPLVLTATAAIGLLSGMLGITGGVIKLPVMVLLCGVPMGIAVATSTAMVAFTAASGLAGHAIYGDVNWHTGLALALVAVAGGYTGSRISLKTDKRRLKRVFGVTSIIMAAVVIIKNYW